MHAFRLAGNLKVNKIAARWPAKAVAQFSTFSKKAVTGLSQDSIVKARPKNKLQTRA